jgi:hypothetical protein
VTSALLVPLSMILLPHRMPALASPGKHPTASNAKTSAFMGGDKSCAPDAPLVLRELKAAVCLKPDTMETI